MKKRQRKKILDYVMEQGVCSADLLIMGKNDLIRKEYKEITIALRGIVENGKGQTLKCYIPRIQKYARS